MKLVVKIELLLIALWLGAACFFSFAVAPSAFSVLPSRELAGSVVNRTLTIINLSGLTIGVLLLISSFFITRVGENKVWRWFRRLLLIIFTVTCGVGQLIIGFYMENLRKSIGRPIEEVAIDDPLRIQFNLWHQYSVWFLVAGMATVLIAFFLVSRSLSNSITEPKAKEISDFELPDELKT